MTDRGRVQALSSILRVSFTLFIIITTIATTSITLPKPQYAGALRNDLDENQANTENNMQPFTERKAAPIATSGENNVYIAWWSNKTGNDEVMFKASSDGGKIFTDKVNLSNSNNSDSQDAQITASGSNVYVSWWERNQTSNEPVLRISNDNGKTFGQLIMLSVK
jgi:hypothetical protein